VRKNDRVRFGDHAGTAPRRPPRYSVYDSFLREIQKALDAAGRRPSSPKIRLRRVGQLGQSDVRGCSYRSGWRAAMLPPPVMLV